MRDWSGGGVGGNVVKGGAYVQAGGWRDLHEKDGLGKAHKVGPTGGERVKAQQAL